jgi:hypothetical protein
MEDSQWDEFVYDDEDNNSNNNDETLMTTQLIDQDAGGDVVTWNETIASTASSMTWGNRSPEMVDDTAYTAVVYGFISPIVIVMTIITNTFVCIVLLQRNMRSPTNLLLVAMAIADSLTGAIPAPSFVYFYTFGAYRRRYVPYGWCRANNALIVTLPTICHTVSIWLTVALSIQRYVYVCHPVEAKRLCTVRSAAKAVTVICIVAALTQSTPMLEWSYVPAEVVVPAAIDNGTASAAATDGGAGDDTVTMYGCYRVMTQFVERHKEVYFSAYWWFRVVFIHLVPCTSLVVLNARLFLAMRAAQVLSLILPLQAREGGEG